MRGAKVQILIPNNAEANWWNSCFGDFALGAGLHTTLHQQTARVIAQELTNMSCPKIVYLVELLSGPEKGRRHHFIPLDWMKIPCNCSTQTLMARGCQNPTHI